MTDPKNPQTFVSVRLHWLNQKPQLRSKAGLTAYRENIGLEDLFSVFVYFENSDSKTKQWQEAKIYALFEEMAIRLPGVGEKLVITDGVVPVAVAEVLLRSAEVI